MINVFISLGLIICIGILTILIIELYAEKKKFRTNLNKGGQKSDKL